MKENFNLESTTQQNSHLWEEEITNNYQTQRNLQNL